jgi:hypothetical protein
MQNENYKNYGNNNPRSKEVNMPVQGEQTERKTHKPIKSFNMGGVQIAVWENIDKNNFPRKSLTIQKRYYNENTKEWNNTNSFNVSDIGKIEIALFKAKELIFSKEEKKEAEEP